MGQYYYACLLEDDKKTIRNYVDSWDYKMGSKLMEHSWMRNPFVKAFENLILNKPSIVVWAGDYADKDEGIKTNVYSRCEEDTSKKTKPDVPKTSPKYLVNHTTKQYVNKTKVPNNDGWQIHPLPLLTAEGNGLGGGDFRREDKNGRIGSWARNLISAETKIPKGYTELKFDLKED